MYAQNIKEEIDRFENHENERDGLNGLIATAKSLHADERIISLLSIRLVGLLAEQNAAVNANMSQDSFAHYIGLTPDQFWKRSQAYRVIRKFPQFGAMIERGEAYASHVAMLSNKITDANADVLASGIQNKSTREVRDFIASVTGDGKILPEAATFVDLKLRLSKSQLNTLERAREILAHGGHVPSTEDLVMQALTELVDRRDPVKKAQRVVNKIEQKLSLVESESTALKQGGLADEATALKQGRQKFVRVRVSAATKHNVWNRDKGYCTHELHKGYPCGSRMMLELDHIIPVAKGGTNILENLTLKCRQHNHWSAVQAFGQDHMDQYRN